MEETINTFQVFVVHFFLIFTKSLVEHNVLVFITFVCQTICFVSVLVRCYGTSAWRGELENKTIPPTKSNFHKKFEGCCLLLGFDNVKPIYSISLY